MTSGESVRATEHYLNVIERLNPKVNALLTVTADTGARASPRRRQGGSRRRVVRHSSWRTNDSERLLACGRRADHVRFWNVPRQHR